MPCMLEEKGVKKERGHDQLLFHGFYILKHVKEQYFFETAEVEVESEKYCFLK